MLKPAQRSLFTAAVLFVFNAFLNRKTMIKLFSFFVLTAWALVFSAPVQTKTISGKVTHAVTGQGLAGVTVTAVGRAAKTQTDQAGNYKIQVAADQQMLVFSLTGFTACKVKIGKTNTLNVKLRPQSIDLKEVAVSKSAKFSPPVIRSNRNSKMEA